MQHNMLPILQNDIAHSYYTQNDLSFRLNMVVHYRPYMMLTINIDNSIECLSAKSFSDI